MNVVDLDSRRTRERELDQAAAFGRAIAHELMDRVRPLLEAFGDDFAALDPEQIAACGRALVVELVQLDGGELDGSDLEQLHGCISMVMGIGGPPPAGA